MNSPGPKYASRSPTAVLIFAATMSACGSSGNGPVDAGPDAPIDGAGEVTADATDAPVSDGATDLGDAAPPFSLGLTPPAVDCAPYAGMSACALRVTPGPPLAGADGLTWQTALSDVQQALDRATCGCAVWIAGGTYLPTRSLDAPGAAPDPRNLSFVLWPGLRVLGGFAGGEADASARAPGHETILSGDLGAAGARDDNAYHVAIGADGAELDGLTLSGGEANGFEAGQSVGAGLFTFGASMTLRNITISDNAADSGAGIFGDEPSRPHLVGCTLARNTANHGGALLVLGDSAVIEGSLFEDNVGVFSGPAITDFANTLTTTDSRFLRNRGDSGGAVTVSAGQATFDRCWFEGNEAGSFGGAMLVRFGATARLASSVLVANGSVGYGGAIAVWTASIDVEGATITDNHAAFGGAFLVKDGARLGLGDSVVWQNDDDKGRAFYLDGSASTIDVATCDAPPEVAAVASFDADPRLANVAHATRFAVRMGTKDQVPITGADRLFTADDRIELGDDGVERRVTAVSGDDLSFAPPLAAPALRFLRIDLWAATAPTLDLDLLPTPGSPLVDAASAAAPPSDVRSHARVGPPDIGALEAL
jgi:Right handed beta helix region